jgi:hypothetical protein
MTAPQRSLACIPAARPVEATFQQLLVRHSHGQDNQRDQAAARRVLQHGIIRRDPLIVSGALSTWLHLWRADIHAALIVDNPAAHRHGARLARAVLRLDHHLTGPDACTHGPTVAAGDALSVTNATRLAGIDLPPDVPVHVQEINRDTVRLHVPTLDASGTADRRDPSWRSLTHAYTQAPSRELDRSRVLGDGIAW